jgi:hypothetical protein
MIPNDPQKGLSTSNMIIKRPGERCKHLEGETPGKYSCKIHNYPWYNKTICYEYGKKERSGKPENTVCKIGKRALEKEKQNEHKMHNNV